MMKRGSQFFLGVVVVVTGWLLARTAYASHQCGSTCNQFTREGICTHGCSVPGANPNPDYRDTNDKQYTNTESVPAEKDTDGGNKQTAEETIKKFNTSQRYEVDKEIHRTTDPYVAANNPGTVKGLPTLAEGSGGTADACTGRDCITFSCTKCGADRRCETGIGENPQFSFGGAAGACNQVDRKTADGKNWEVVSLCDPSCSGPETTTTNGNGDTPLPSDLKEKSNLTCKSIVRSVEKPVLNQTVTFTCKASFSAHDPVYEFRHRADGGAYTTVPGVASSDKKQASAEITIDQAGAWEVQCRVCTNESKSKCTDWGKNN